MIGRAVRIGAVGVALGIAAATLQCTPDEDGDRRGRCAALCLDLARCGMLPSTLGAGNEPVHDCTDRCEISAPSTSESLEKCELVDTGSHCQDEHRDTGFHELSFLRIEDRWCCQSGCAALAQCVTSAMGPEARPTGSLAVSFGLAGSEADLWEPVSAQYRNACVPSSNIGALDSKAYCEQSSVVHASVFVESDGETLRGDSQSCDFSLAAEARFDDVPVGPVRVGAQLRVLEIDLEDVTVSRSHCMVFWGPRVMVFPNQRAEAVIPLPDPTTILCPPEQAGASGGGGADGGGGDDGTGGGTGGGGENGGFSATDGPDCAMTTTSCRRFFCESDPESCGDGCDNDGDRVPDCADSSCRQLSACKLPPTP